MRHLLCFAVIAFLLINNASSQTTYSPSCFSNAHGWTITKIENTATSSFVYLKFYYHTNYNGFYINSRMYIENYNNRYSPKLYIKRFVNNELDTKYNASSKTSYDFIFEFDRIPSDWTDINIVEPDGIDGSRGFFWKYISLNKPHTSRLKIDNFLLNKGIKFLAGAAHPFTNYQFSVYSIEYDTIHVTLYYEGDISTYVKIIKDGDFFKRIRVMYDNDCDFCYPFTTLGILKDMVFSQENHDKSTSSIEKYLGKVINDMDGNEVTSVVLTLLWLSY